VSVDGAVLLRSWWRVTMRLKFPRLEPLCRSRSIRAPKTNDVSGRNRIDSNRCTERVICNSMNEGMPLGPDSERRMEDP
jgi:hypothetical protein